jgi:hypothetical protein
MRGRFERAMMMAGIRLIGVVEEKREATFLFLFAIIIWQRAATPRAINQSI